MSHDEPRPAERHDVGDAAALPRAEDAAAAITDRPSAFFNALLTEQFVLETARGITVNEASSRATIYLATLSSALVGFGFLASTPFAGGYLAAIIPVVVLLGFFTFDRLVQTSLEDVAALAGIQRIRAFHRTLLPGAEAYFPMPPPPHFPNELLDIGERSSWRGVFFTTSSAVAAVNSLVCGIGGALLLLAIGAAPGAAITTGIAIAVLLAVLQGLVQKRRYSRLASILTTGTSTSAPRADPNDLRW